MRQLEGTQPEDLAGIREQQQGVVGACHKQVLHVILVFELAGRLATATTLLRPVGINGLHLGVTTVGQGHYHGFFGDQVFHAQVETGGDDFGTALVGIFLTDRLQFITDHFHQTFGVTQNLQQFGNLLQQFLVIVDQFFPFQTGQLLQTQIQNRLGLFRAQVIKAITQTELLIEAIRASRVFTTGALQHLQYIAGSPAFAQKFFLGFRAAGGRLDQRNHRIDIAQRHRQTF